MDTIHKEIDELYEFCGIPKDLDYGVITSLNAGNLTQRLSSGETGLKKNSVFSYAACGASSVGLDWLSENGYRV